MYIKHGVRQHPLWQGTAGSMMKDGRRFLRRNLELARAFRGLTQCELARQVSISNALVSYYECGRLSAPPHGLLEAWAEALGFQSEFFFTRIHDPFRHEECSFRDQNAPERVKTRAIAIGTLAGVVIGYINKRVGLPAYNVPSLRRDGEHQTIEDIARRCRAAWHLDLDTPIPHIAQVLERSGVPIITLAIHEDFTTFSRRGRTPVVIAKATKEDPCSLIVDLAHELGHFVCHVDVRADAVEAEREADAFAGAFLMPARAFTKEFTAVPFSWDHIFFLKARWHVTPAAVVGRGYALGLLDTLTYRRVRQELLAGNWRTRKPREPDEQEPTLLRDALRSLSESGEPPAEVCRRLHIRSRTLHDLTGIEIP